MPRPRATADSSQYKAGPIKDDLGDLLSPSSARGSDHYGASGYRKLSFLAAVVNTDDMGCANPGYPFDYAQWEERRNLRRATLEQGSSTFSFPAKRGPKF